MSDVVSSGVDAPARAPLLRSPENPVGYDLRALLGQIRDELAAQNASLRQRAGSAAHAEIAQHQEVLKALTAADSLLARPAAVSDAVIRFPGRDVGLPPGRNHPGEPPYSPMSRTAA